jgi:predicted lactoylglutathione lyase
MEGEHRDFWIGEHPESHGVHVAFLAKDKAAVDAFYAAGLAAGGTDNGLPGHRELYNPANYAAFVYDPDGNNLEAVWFDLEKKS